MNMLIRFLLLLHLLDSQKKQHLTRPPALGLISHTYRILPHDMGWRHHLPNYRYLSFIELNITQWLRQQSDDKLAWIISAQQMTYLKEVKLLDILTVNSQLLGWDKKYLYFRHEFTVKNQRMAVGLTKFLLMKNGSICAPQTLAGVTEEKTHDVISTWQANQNAIKTLTPIG